MTSPPTPPQPPPPGPEMSEGSGIDLHGRGSSVQWLVTANKRHSVDGLRPPFHPVSMGLITAGDNGGPPYVWTDARGNRMMHLSVPCQYFCKDEYFPVQRCGNPQKTKNTKRKNS